MAERQENIESKLCDYVDGLLGEREREEIEAYLDRYPESRKLVDDLIRQRVVLRDLPRQNAPADLVEHFQGRLERSVLLSDLDMSHGEQRLSYKRRPHFAAMAAV